MRKLANLGVSFKSFVVSDVIRNVLPNGYIKGLPASITFMGQLFGEGKLLYAAQVYQQATKFHKQHPSMNFL